MPSYQSILRRKRVTGQILRRHIFALLLFFYM